MSESRTLRLAFLAAVVGVASFLAVGIATPDDDVHPPGLYVRIGTLHVGDGTVVENALVRMDEGRFVSVERADPPEGVRVLEFPRAHAAPGFVDVVTSLGVRGAAVESVEVLTPGVRAADAFDPDARALDGLLESGTTTIGLLPGPSNLACGSAGAAGLRKSHSAALLQREGPPVFSLQSPALGSGRVPATLAGARLLLGAALRGERWSTPAEAEIPVRREALVRLSELTSGNALVYVDSSRAAGLAVDLLQPRGLRPVLIGLGGAGRDPEAVAALGVPCVVTGLGPDDRVSRLALPGALARAGASVSLSSGAPSRSARTLRLAIALAVANGLPTEQAVGAVTHGPAVALGIEDRVGRVAEGLEADLVVFDGPPWELRSRVLLVVADGRIAVKSKQRGKQ